MPKRGYPSASTRARQEEERKRRRADECARYAVFKAIDDAYRAGDLDALLEACGDPPDFPNAQHPHELGLGYPLEYAIYWSPLPFIRTLLEHGADPNYDDGAGFPSLMATLSTQRPDKLDVVRLLLSFGASVAQRGLNDWTPLHYAANLDDADAVEPSLVPRSGP